MTPSELAVLRDRVARARQERQVFSVENLTQRRGRRGWTPEREAAGNRALAALREAERRANPQPAKPPRLNLRCVYCGESVRLRDQSKRAGVPATCMVHRDLPSLDPFYMEVSNVGA